MDTKNNIQKLKESFYQATGKTLSEWEEMGIPYKAIPDIIFFYILHSQKQEKAINTFKEIAPKYYGIDPVSPNHIKTVKDFLILFEKKDLGENESFISAAVTIYLPYFKNDVLKNSPRPQLPQCKNKDEIFLDLITGFNFIKFYPDLKEDTFYYLVDTSLFACEGLRQEKELFPRLNIRIIRKNVLQLSKEDFHAPVSVLRAKNLFGYVNIHKPDIQRLQDLIRPGGSFVFQEDSSRKKSYPTKVANWFKGWKKTTKRGNPEDKNDLDTFTYVKPK